ncbi:hypothetical protein M0812_27974 [Anaeramoeba flamelloides]|uniref:Uncharacterized protein n=1 Tax=Anaeramoeba flamelloides TaxID=1746091 RepID=A0AAV7YDG5_9EUKA|nr:hypothetical protein M0812_27974 [Anaeramoeba flamelloides]
MTEKETNPNNENEIEIEQAKQKLLKKLNVILEQSNLDETQMQIGTNLETFSFPPFDNEFKEIKDLLSEEQQNKTEFVNNFYNDQISGFEKKVTLIRQQIEIGQELLQNKNDLDREEKILKFCKQNPLDQKDEELNHLFFQNSKLNSLLSTIKSFGRVETKSIDEIKVLLLCLEGDEYLFLEQLVESCKYIQKNDVINLFKSPLPDLKTLCLYDSIVLCCDRVLEEEFPFENQEELQPNEKDLFEENEFQSNVQLERHSIDLEKLGGDLFHYVKQGGGLVLFAPFLLEIDGPIEAKGSLFETGVLPITKGKILGLKSDPKSKEIQIGEFLSPNHRIVKGISHFSKDFFSIRVDSTIDQNGIVNDIAQWEDSTPLITSRNYELGKIVVLNYWPLSQDVLKQKKTENKNMQSNKIKIFLGYKLLEKAIIDSIIELHFPEKEEIIN